jgi:HK97 family phage prohead protease
MDFKRASYDLKDFDEKQGIVVAYANAYGNTDDDGDISDQVSFTKTVKQNKKRIRVLKDHDRRISLGVPLEINPADSFGLLTKTKFNMQKEVSRDMFTDIQLLKENDQNAELSIGVDILKRDQSNKSRVLEYRLWEYSFLTSWAANELATVGDVKALKTVSGIVDFIEKKYNLNYSDPTLRKIERLLKDLHTSETEEQKKSHLTSTDFRNKILLTYSKII